MGTPSKISPIRQLVPKSYHFDGYNELNCPNSRDKPFFSDTTVPMGDYTLTTRLLNQNTLEVLFSSVCPEGKIIFQPLRLTLDEYIQKLKEAINDKRDFIYLEVSITYPANSFCDSRTCCFATSACTKLRGSNSHTVFAAVSFHMEEVQHALSIYHGITTNYQEVSTMRSNSKKFFGMNFSDFGISKDANIASTLMGVAVRNRNTGDWITFDLANRKRTNISIMKMGNFPIFILPVQTLNVGDLIKLEGKYYYVESIRPDNNRQVTLLSPEDGTIQEHLLSDSIIPGLNFYAKVVAMDLSSMTDASSKQNMSSNMLAAVCMMQWSKGSNADSFSSLDDVDDDSFNGLGKYLPLLALSGGSLSGLPSTLQGADGKPNFMALLALGSAGGDDDDTMKLMLLSQMLCGNNILSAAPVSPSGTGEMLCESCGEHYSSATVFCPKCGTRTVTKSASPTKGEVYCEACKTVYPSGTVFCPKCGKKTIAKVVACPHCNAELMADAIFCHKCGKKVLPDSCHSCGNTLTGSEAFCPKCGASVAQVAETPSTDAEVPLPTDPKSEG